MTAVLAVLAACGTSAGYRAEVNQWIGQSAEAVMAAWGEPAERLRFNDGSSYMAYRGMQIPGGQITYFPLVTGERTCWTRFLVNIDGTIRSVRYRGNACRR